VATPLEAEVNAFCVAGGQGMWAGVIHTLYRAGDTCSINKNRYADIVPFSTATI